MKNDQRKDDALWDALVLMATDDADHDALEHEAKDAKDSLTQDEKYHLDAITKKVVQKEFARQKMISLHPSIQKLAVCFAVFIVVSAAVVMSVSAWRMTATDYILSLFDDHGVFSIKKATYNDDAAEYVPSDIPAEYFNKEVLIDDANDLIIYYYGADYNNGFSYHLIRTPTNALLDTENAKVKTVEYNGTKYDIINKDGTNQLIGIIPDVGKQYVLIGNFSEEVIIDIAESIRKKEE